jgi:hypothetical protein
LNPSTADDLTMDQTVQRVENWARLKEITNVCYLNLFAFRATKPRELSQYSYEKIIGERNNMVLSQELKERDTIIIGWGNSSNIPPTFIIHLSCTLLCL